MKCKYIGKNTSHATIFVMTMLAKLTSFFAHTKERGTPTWLKALGVLYLGLFGTFLMVVGVVPLLDFLKGTVGLYPMMQWTAIAVIIFLSGLAMTLGKGLTPWNGILAEVIMTISYYVAIPTVAVFPFAVLPEPFVLVAIAYVVIVAPMMFLSMPFVVGLALISAYLFPLPKEETPRKRKFAFAAIGVTLFVLIGLYIALFFVEL